MSFNEDEFYKEYHSQRKQSGSKKKYIAEIAKDIYEKELLRAKECDTKSSILLSVSSIMLALLLFSLKSVFEIDKTGFSNCKDNLYVLILIILIITALLLFATIICLLLSLATRGFYVYDKDDFYQLQKLRIDIQKAMSVLYIIYYKKNINVTNSKITRRNFSFVFLFLSVLSVSSLIILRIILELI